MTTRLARFSPGLQSTWQNMQAWRQSRRAAVARFSDESTGLRNALASTVVDQISGGVNLVAQAAIKRIQGESSARFNALLAQSSASPLLKDAMVQAVLYGGARADLKAGTVTLPDGTVIDVKTGRSTVKITA